MQKLFDQNLYLTAVKHYLFDFRDTLYLTPGISVKTRMDFIPNLKTSNMILFTTGIYFNDLLCYERRFLNTVIASSTEEIMHMPIYDKIHLLYQQEKGGTFFLTLLEEDKKEIKPSPYLQEKLQDLSRKVREECFVLGTKTYKNKEGVSLTLVK